MNNKSQKNIKIIEASSNHQITKSSNQTISVIIPVYNAAQHLPRCLQSICNQTHKNIELIVIDDCSNDHSISVVKNFFDTSEKNNEIILKLISHDKNRGVAAARNTGLDNASGDYIYFVDADDWIEPETLFCLLNETLQKNYDILGHELWFHYGKKRHIKMPNITSGEDAFIKMTTGELRWNLWLYLVKRNLYEQNKIRFLEGMNMGEDMMVMGKLFLCSKNSGIIHQPFYNYVSANPTSVTKEKSEARIFQMTANLNELQNFVIQHKRNDFFVHLQQLILQVKIPLLFSNSMEDYKKWLSWFPEANQYALRNKKSPIRNRMLQYAVIKKMFFVLKLHYFVTNIFLKLIYK
jgi:glycosyltransferase involved in cell wall biosynthesis